VRLSSLDLKLDHSSEPMIRRRNTGRSILVPDRSRVSLEFSSKSSQTTSRYATFDLYTCADQICGAEVVEMCLLASHQRGKMVNWEPQRVTSNLIRCGIGMATRSSRSPKYIQTIYPCSFANSIPGDVSDHRRGPRLGSAGTVPVIAATCGGGRS
jgi:hypothetical protein